VIKYRIRNKKTGELVCYGQTTEVLNPPNKHIAQDLVDELQDYGIDSEIVEIESE
jgi:hypothetical protein